jgi:A/G-specific adenine glycosylase
MARTRTIISGGQTGVDRAALDAALQVGLPVDGWCPRGRLAEDGPLAAKYPLRETPSSNYAQRTEWNVRDSDGTLILSYGRLLGGTALTRRLAEKLKRPYLRINLAEPTERRGAAQRILSWVEEHSINRLNIAGPRGSTDPQLHGLARRLLLRLMKPMTSLDSQSELPENSPKKIRRGRSADRSKVASGDEGSRTLDLSIANAALSQLSYVPGDEPILRTASGVDKFGFSMQGRSDCREGEAPAEPDRKRKAPPARAARQEPRPPDCSNIPNPWTDADTRTLQQALPRWFTRFGRELPWRETNDPYRIWISEVMLQQTTVTAVKPYYERFLARFPDVTALAFAEEQEVLRLWEGLGYYSRGRNLHKAARIVFEQFQGEFPKTVAGLRQLPGIGQYVAGAVASFAFDLPAPIVEANTLRLYCRLLGFTGDPRNSAGQQLLWKFAESILPRKSPGDFNQALMDLGATVCTVANPECPRCPLLAICRAAAAGTQAQIPQKASRPEVTDVTELTVAVVFEGRVFLRRRSADERWAGLWDFPRFACEVAVSESKQHQQIASHLRSEYGIAARDIEALTRIRHSVTRYRIDLHAFVAQSHGPIPAKLRPDQEWVDLTTLTDRPMSVTGRKVASELIQRAAE